jgi:hypothetical protein
MRVIRNTTWDAQLGARMQRQLLIAFGGGIASALLLVGSLTGAGGLLLANFAPLPLFLVGFMSGARSVVMAGAAASVALLFLGGIDTAAFYAGTTMIPAWIIVYHGLSHRFTANGATDWYSMGEIVSRLCALIAIFIVVVSLAVSGAQGGIENSINRFVETIITQIVKMMALDLNSDGVDLLVDRMTMLFPAVTTLSWLLMIVVNATVAQALLVKWNKALRPSPRYRSIEAPEWAYWAIVGAAAIKLIGSDDLEYVAQNLVVILGVPFFLVGLAVAHSLAHRLKMPGLGLGLLYASFLVLTWAPVAVAAMGFAEQWVRLRDRYGRIASTLTPHSQSEDE